ncbi:uncharacterized protein [Aegilops tauschii subsp. strangulata]|nr:uncharacterized protein LOC109762736 [Aegilops tauschii subsp. strangulata]
MASFPYSPRLRQPESSAWPDLPPELLEKVFRSLDPLGRVAVRLVCSSWRSCARAAPAPFPAPFEAPLLLLRRQGSGSELAVFSLRRREILPFALPAGRCCGQIGGWLAMASDGDRAVALCNVFSGESVALAQALAFPVAKVVLSAPPTSLGWVAALLSRSGRTVELVRPDSVMSVSGRTTIDAGGSGHGGFQDVAFWRGRLCALADDGAVLAYRANLRARVAAVCELRGEEVGHQLYNWDWRRVNLVESDGELLLVARKVVQGIRRCSCRPRYSVEVEVRRFLPARREWEAATELPGGKAVFVGTAASVAVSPAAALGVRKNCVYFAQRNEGTTSRHAIGVYSLGDRETTVVGIAGGHFVDVEPFWISPSVA